MDGLAELRGESPGIAAIRHQVALLLRRHSDARRLPPILIQGETGTGKGLLARAIHRESPRHGGPFVDVNCAAIPETLLEAEMFGFERGAFTDARQSKPGLLQAAHRGTIFLDEIGLLSERLQAKLLKAVEDRAVRRLGGVSAEPTDAWIITASNQDLLTATRAGRFREDLYHRLAGFAILLPPLRQRGRDVLLLAQHFLTGACTEYGLPAKTLTSDAEAALVAHPWPGNVRELANLMERVALLSDSSLVTADALGLAAAFPEARDPERSEASGSLDDALRDHLLVALEATDWNISQTAERLRVTRNTVRARMEKYGVRPPLPGRRGRPLEKATPAADDRSPAAEARPQASHTGSRSERRGLAILTATLVPRSSPDEVVDLSRPLDTLIEIVRTFGGSVQTIDSQSILAIFGLHTVEDWSRRAAACAMASQLAVRRDEHNRWGVKAAIHFGHFLVCKIGGAATMDPDEKREAWTRLEALLARAEPDTILVSESAARLLERRFVVVPVGGPDRAGGPAYRLAGSEPSAFGVKGRVGAFVGRRHELGLLRSKYLLATRGRGSVVAIVGDAGIGKSRLLSEFRNSLREDRVLFLEGHCASYGTAAPYLPMLDVIRACCGITDADGPAAVADRVRSAMLRLEMSVADAAPYILQLLGLKEGPDRSRTLGPEATKMRTFEALRQLVLKASKQQPLILVVEDLHWSDKTSQEFLESLVDSMSGAPILLVVTYRPGYRLAWVEKSYATQIALDPLSPEDSLSIVNDVGRHAPLPAPLIEAILGKAEGNPFFLEELTRAVLEQPEGTDIPTVPATIHGVLMARLDRLLVDTKHVLQNASVLGRAFSSRLLGAIGKTPGGLDPHLRELERLEFIYTEPGAGDGNYVFKHALTHDVVYASLPIQRRQALHEAAGRALESFHHERLDEHYELLAYHYGRSANVEKALEYLEAANRKAGAANAMDEAKAYFDEAMRVLDGLPDTAENQGHRIALLANQGTVMLLLFKFKECYDLLTRYEPLAARLGDPGLLGPFYGCLGHCVWSFGELDRAIQTLGAAAQLSEAAGNAEAAGYAYMLLQWSHLYKADYREVLRYEEHALMKMEKRFNLRTATWARAAASWVYSFRGRWNEAVREGEREMQLAQDYADNSTIAFAAMMLSIAYAFKGDLARAVEYGETAVKRAVTPADRAWAQGVLGLVLCRSGDPARASDLLREVVAIHRATGFLGAEFYALWLGEAYWRAGDRQRAVETLTEEVEIAERCGMKFFLGSARRLLGEIALADSTTDTRRVVQDHFSHSIDLLQEIGAENELALAYSGYARLLSQSGDDMRAREYLGRALEIFDRLGTLIEPGTIQQE